MYNNNLTINDKIKIPLKENFYYNIRANLFINHTISIEVEKNCDLIDLYIIIKSYSCNVIYIPHNFFTVVNNPNKPFFMAYATHIRTFKEMGYLDFCLWFMSRIENDWLYVKEDGKYYLTFTYPIEIFDRDKLKDLIPIYPWDRKIIESVTYSFEKEKKFEELLKIKDQKIIDLNQKIIELENIINKNKK